MRLFTRRMWAFSLVFVMAAATLLVGASRAEGPSATANGSSGFGPSPDARTPAMPSMDPAMQRLLDTSRAPQTEWDKMTSSVREAVRGGTGTFRAAILTDDVNTLGAFLRSSGVDTRIGSVPTTMTGLRVVTIDVPVRLLQKIAALDGVYTVAPDVVPDAPERAEWEGPRPTAPREGPEPTLIEAGKGHHVPEAWAFGYMGSGVRVAPMDSGTDFGHPDLQGTFATHPSTSWPIVFDPNSMASYLLGGGAFPQAPTSWFVNTSFASTPDGAGNLSVFNGHTYNVAGIPSASGIYRLGLHPDLTLRTFYYGEFVALLLTDSSLPGLYDTVYVDLNANYAFGDDKPATVGSPDLWMDTSGDGIADISGGLVYFIADGSSPIPYSDVLGARYGLPVPIPSNGELVALQFGDALVPAGDHGSLVASSIVAQNVTGAVQGFAPLAKLISVGNIYAGGFGFDIYTFVAEGYDGVPGTGDEAHVASASFGYSGIFQDGWDFESRWVEFMSLVFPDTAYVVSSGNGGHGFGTVTSPSSSTGVISVGASTSYQSATPFPVGASEDAAHSTFGDVQPWSNRGPSTLGTGKPDVVTVGAWATGDGTLNEFFGDPPWYVWGGTSLSAPATAAILALVVESYAANVGGPLFNQYAKVLLTGSADNIHYDPQVMGHGLTNAYRAVQAAAYSDGLAAYHSTSSGISPAWVAGGFRGTSYASFTNLMRPGDSAIDSFVVENHDCCTDKDVLISDWELVKTGTDTWTVNARNANESAPDFLRPDYLFNLTELVPAGTILVRATVSHSLAELDPNGDYNHNSRWRVLLYDWRDYDGNGTYWNDTNGNGVVNVGEMDTTSGTEIQRFTYGYPTGTILQAFVHDPLARIGDGLLLGIQHRTVSALVPTTNLTVTVDYYAAMDAPWLGESVSGLTVFAGSSDVFDVTVSLPADQPFGTLSGAVRLEDLATGADTLIPVVVHVAATGTSFAFGGDPNSNAFLDNNRMFGGFDWTWRAEAGDWRFFYTDVPDSTPIAPGEQLLVHTWWSTAPTDLDTFIFGPTPDPFSALEPSIWGPYGLSTAGRSANELISAGRWRFRTASGGPEEWVAAPLSKGLHAIGLHNVLNAGTAPSDLFNGEVGTFNIRPSPWLETTTNATGKEAFNATTSLALPGLEVRAFGVSAPSFTTDLPIANGGQYVEFFTATNPGLIDIAIGESSPQGMDIDLYLYRRVGMAYVLVASGTTPAGFEEVRLTMPQSGDYRIIVDGFTVPAGTGTFDLLKLIIQGTQLTPTDVPGTGIPSGTTVGFNVSWNFANTRAGVHFGILFVGPTGAPAVEVLAAFVLIDDKDPVILSTDPAPNAFVNDPAARITASYVDPAISAGISSVSLVIDGVDFTFLATFNDTELSLALPLTFSEGPHTVDIAVRDGVGHVTEDSWTFTVDTSAPSLSVTSPDYALTRNPSATVTGTTDVGATVTVNGVSAAVDGTGRFTRAITLAGGANTITVVATDSAGNSARVTRSVTLDTTAPSLTVTSPADGSRVTTNVVPVLGTTEPGASVSVNGASAAVAPDGSFAVSLALEDGSRTIETIATDAAGNTRSDLRTIDVGPAPDATAPVVTVTSPADNTLTDEASILVSGTVDDPDAIVIVNGIQVRPSSTGAWSVAVGLVSGTNTITVSAIDRSGNQGAAITRTVTYSSPVPGINQAVTSLSGNLILGIAIVFVALAGIMFALYSNLNRKIADLRPKPPEPPMPPPEGGKP